MRKKIKILEVEDEAITAFLLAKELSECGYEVASRVPTGEKAIVTAREFKPDIILMDIRLAGKIDGIDAAIRIKAESDIPVIFITGYEDREMRERAVAIKPWGIFIKPVEIIELRKSIDAYFTKEVNAHGSFVQ
ncbi:MAG: response regulator [Spirochaetes bacterium]|nr:MAG: response regulator [Spirochaetota bacterium]